MTAETSQNTKSFILALFIWWNPYHLGKYTFVRFWKSSYHFFSFYWKSNGIVSSQSISRLQTSWINSFVSKVKDVNIPRGSKIDAVKLKILLLVFWFFSLPDWRWKYLLSDPTTLGLLDILSNLILLFWVNFRMPANGSVHLFSSTNLNPLSVNIINTLMIIELNPLHLTLILKSHPYKYYSLCIG